MILKYNAVGTDMSPRVLPNQVGFYLENKFYLAIPSMMKKYITSNWINDNTSIGGKFGIQIRD